MIKDKIDKYKENLYSRKYKNTNKKDWEKMSNLKKNKNNNLDNNWSSVEERLEKNKNLYKYQNKETSIFSVLLYIAISFFIIAVGVASFFLYFQKNEVPLNQLELSLISPNSIDSGEILEYALEFENNTEHVFYNIEVFVKYPKGSLDHEYQIPKEKDDWEVEDVLPGGMKRVKKKITLSGSPKDKKEIEVSVNYQLKGYSSIFTQKKKFSVKIDSAPVFVKINTPKDVMSNEEFEIDIEVLSNSNTTLKNLVLIGRYPSGFEVTDHEPKATFSTNYKHIFIIPELKIGEKKNIKIKGKLRGENSETKVLSFVVGDSDNDSDKIRIEFFNTKEKIVIKKPSLDLKLVCSKVEIKDKPLIVVAGKELTCNFRLNNNLLTKVTDIDIKLNYKDDLIEEFKILSENGYIDSNNDFILWDKNTLPELAILKGGESISAEFKMTLAGTADLAGYVKNPQIDWNFELSGTNFNDEFSIGRINNEITKTLKFNTDIVLDTGVYYDSSPFENSGGPTPKVGEETTYTITWKIYNSTNKIKDVKVKAILPMGVEFENVIFPDTNYVSYDKDTRQIKWSIKSMEPYIGYRTDPKTMSFKVSYIPTISEAAMFKDLVEDKILTAKDLSTGEIIEVIVGPDTTRMKGEKDYKYDVGQVIR